MERESAREGESGGWKRIYTLKKIRIKIRFIVFDEKLKKMKTGLFDRSNRNGDKALMELTQSSSNTDHSNNFEFAFNSSNFSDRVLRIEVVAGASESKSEGEECSSLADWARPRKRRREEIMKDKAAEFDVYNSDNVVSCNQPDTEDAVAFENHYAEAAVAMTESPTGDGSSQSDSGSKDCSPVLRVNSMYVNSAILAAKSPFFYKLFSNGMLESDQRHATLRIYASEEAALMELLSFMYSGKLSTNSPPRVLDVLMAADKFEAASCMWYCSQLLRNQSMTPESALLYLELPSSVSMAPAVRPLIDAAREFLASKFRDITKFQDEVMNLPLVGIEAILSSDNLQVPSEDMVYDFVLRWARARYPKAEERREMLGSHLGRLIRFPFMTCWKLKEVLACNDLDHEISSKAVLEALFFKAETPHRQRALLASADRRYIERSYILRPVKVVEFESPHPQRFVYLDLKKEECVNLFPGGRVFSQRFHLGGRGFILSAQCNMDPQGLSHCFGLFLGVLDMGSVTFTVGYEFAARAKPAGDFVDLVSKHKACYSFTRCEVVGYEDLFATPWTAFVADDSLYFINGILHLRAEITIKRTQPAAAA